MTTIARADRAAPVRRDAPPAPQPAHSPTSYRADVDGLRAIAIVLVVLFHCDVAGFTAGFTGVDIFFVISGFVITTSLFAEHDRSATISLLSFWARRARRLLPAATVIVLAVLAASLLVYTPLSLPRVLSGAYATTLYRSNFYFSAHSVDYFNPFTARSPFLHTWSLAVEEQFYLFWPVLMWACFRYTRSRRAIGLAIAALTAGSLYVAWLAHVRHDRLAFFLPIGRAWEFGAGALLAVGAPLIRSRLGSLGGLALGLIGTVLVAAGLWQIDAQRGFPSPFTLLPVLGTVALIGAGTRSSSAVAKLLAREPLPWIGRLSYSWYLWHWPVLILGTERVTAPSTSYKVLLGVGSLVPAWVTYRAVEHPIRTNRRLAGSLRLTAALAVSCVIVALLATALVERHNDRELADPLMAALNAAQRDYTAVPWQCAGTDAATLADICRYGAIGSAEQVLLLGDSHAMQWLPTLERAAQAESFELTVSVLGACPSISDGAAFETAECANRRAGIDGLVRTMKPDLVVMTHSIGYLGSLVDREGHTLPAGEQQSAWEEATSRFARSLAAQNIGLLVILDTPRYPDAENPLQCAARHHAISPCELSTADAVATARAGHEAELAALARAGHGAAYDPFPLICNDDRCPLTTPDGTVTYADTHHITGSFARSLASDFEPVLARALAQET